VRAETAKRLTELRARLSHRTGRNGFGTARDVRGVHACPGAWPCHGWNAPPSIDAFSAAMTDAYNSGSSASCTFVHAEARRISSTGKSMLQFRAVCFPVCGKPARSAQTGLRASLLSRFGSRALAGAARLPLPPPLTCRSVLFKFRRRPRPLTLRPSDCRTVVCERVASHALLLQKPISKRLYQRSESVGQTDVL
jgi:hypothetical protein